MGLSIKPKAAAETPKETSKPIDGKLNIEKQQEAAAQTAAENTKAKKGLTLTKKQPEASQHIETKDSGKVTSESTTEITKDLPQVNDQFSQPWCEVKVGASYTHNLGNYQSARVEVSLMIPCKHEEINDIYTTAEEWVNGKMNELREGLVNG